MSEEDIMPDELARARTLPSAGPFALWGMVVLAGFVGGVLWYRYFRK